MEKQIDFFVLLKIRTRELISRVKKLVAMVKVTLFVTGGSRCCYGECVNSSLKKASGDNADDSCGLLFYLHDAFQSTHPLDHCQSSRGF